MKALSKPLSSAAAIAISLALASCASPGGEPLEVTKGLVVRNVNIVNTRDGATSAQMAVVIEGSSIRKIAPDRLIRTSGTVQTIDGTGKYLVPGFLDMHTHAMAAADQPVTFWPLLIANGVTGIREMAGSPEVIKRVSQLNADSAAGRVDAVIADAVTGKPLEKKDARTLLNKIAEGTWICGDPGLQYDLLDSLEAYAVEQQGRDRLAECPGQLAVSAGLAFVHLCAFGVEREHHGLAGCGDGVGKGCLGEGVQNRHR